jgi:parvulin-like peptidyl-prolyl isomerase
MNLAVDRSFRRTLTMSVLLVLLAACRSVSPDAIVIARYNEHPLTLQDAMETFLDSHVGHGVLVQGEPAVRELAGRIIERRVFLEEAETLGLHQEEAVLAAVDDYALRTAELLYWRREVDERVSISDEEVERFYDKTDQALSISLIETAERELAEELLRRIQEGEEFRELARQHSIHSSAELNGELGFVKRGEIDPALEAPLFALSAEGEFTPITQTAEGWAFARLDQRTINEIRPDREVAIPQIRSILEERAKDRLRDALTEGAEEQAGVSVEDALLTRESLLGEDDPEAVVARSAGEQLTLEAFRNTLNLEAIRAAPDETVEEAARSLAREWARKQAIWAEVRRSGLLEDPEIVAKVRVFREDAALQLLYQRYVYADIDPGEEEIRAYYDENHDTEFTRPPEVRLAFIAVPTREEVEAVMQRLAAGEDFATIAREVSVDPASAAHGGRIGWVRPGTVLPELEDAVFALDKGAIDGPIETSEGWFVISALDRRPPQPLSYEVCRSIAEQRLTTRLQKEAYREWGLRLKDRSVSEIDDAGIAQAVEWLDQEAERRAAEQPPADTVAVAEIPEAPDASGASDASDASDASESESVQETP